MSKAALKWIDAQTPHAKVLREEQIEMPTIQYDADVQAAIERVEAFQARLSLEALEQPLIVIESA